ncbi:MAG: hypothetical protein WB676_18720 [Bryobacteraceae bacterium]
MPASICSDLLVLWSSAEFPGAPAFHSFISANYDGKWVLIGGRTNGYHQSGGKDTDFSRVEANQKIWVTDTAGSAPHCVSILSVVPLSALIEGVTSGKHF